MSDTHTDKFMHDMRAVVIDAEELLKATAGQAGERIDKVRTRAEESLKVARARLLAAGETLETTAREVNGQVHQHPYVTAGVAAGIGVLVGLLIGRR